MSNSFFRKSCSLWNNVENPCRAGQATDDSKRMRIDAGYLGLQMHTQAV